jgi:hypothetical protein
MSASTDRQDFREGCPLDTADTGPLLGHRYEGLNAAFHRREALSHCGRLSIGGDHQKRSESLKEHRHHPCFDRFGGVMEGFHLFDDGSKLRGCDQLGPILPESLKDTAHRRNPSTDFINELLVHPVEFVQNAPDVVHADMIAFLFGPKDDGIEHVAGRFHGP